jgi:hypothetical protein
MGSIGKRGDKRKVSLPAGDFSFTLCFQVKKTDGQRIRSGALKTHHSVNILMMANPAKDIICNRG